MELDQTQFAHTLLSPEEEITLIRRAKQGDLEAQDKLIMYNQRLVASRANHFFHGGIGGDQTLEDLIQWGNIGLVTAIQRWDPQRDNRFSTYAIYWVDAIIYREGTTKGFQCKISYRSAWRVSRIRRSRSRLNSKLQREPTAEEIFRESGIPLNFIRETMIAQPENILALNGVIDEDGHELCDILVDSSSEPVAQAGERLALLDQVRAAIERLPAEEKQVILSRYGGDQVKNYVEVGRDVGYCHTTAKVIEDRALRMLRNWLRVGQEQ
jgi:RNA polymerase primary sigma factor